MIRRAGIAALLFTLASCDGEPAIAADPPKTKASAPADDNMWTTSATPPNVFVQRAPHDPMDDLIALYRDHPSAFCADARALWSLSAMQDLTGDLQFYKKYPTAPVIVCPSPPEAPGEKP